MKLIQIVKSIMLAVLRSKKKGEELRSLSFLLLSKGF